MSKYSDAEILLFNEINYYGTDVINTVPPVPLYQMLAWKAFINKDGRSCIPALRRACIAIQNCSPYRHTPEFEKLLEF